MADHDLFAEDEVEPEIVPDLPPASTSQKLDEIIELLRKNQDEHQEIRDRLDKIERNQATLEANQNSAFAHYQQVGTKLGELIERCEERHSPKPQLLAAEMASRDQKQQR